jgi:hypothetical protein
MARSAIDPLHFFYCNQQYQGSKLKLQIDLACIYFHLLMHLLVLCHAITKSCHFYNHQQIGTTCQLVTEIYCPAEVLLPCHSISQVVHSLQTHHIMKSRRMYQVQINRYSSWDKTLVAFRF